MRKFELADLVKLKGRAIEMTWSEEQQEKSMKKNEHSLRDLQNTTKHIKYMDDRSHRRREKVFEIMGSVQVVHAQYWAVGWSWVLWKPSS